MKRKQTTRPTAAELIAAFPKDWMLMADGSYIHKRDYSIGMAVGEDAANHQMHKANRAAWNLDDSNLAAARAMQFMSACAAAYA